MIRYSKLKEKIADFRMGKKLMASFGVVLLLTACMGYVGYSALDRIIRIVSITDDAGEIVKIVEALLQEEKAFIIRGDEESKKAVHGLTQELHDYLNIARDKIEVEADQKQVDEIALLLADYKTEFDKYVELKGKKDKYETTMKEKGRSVMAIASRIHQSQKAEFVDVMDQSGIAEDDKLWKADGAHRLIVFVQRACLAEKNFIAKGDTKYADQVDGIIYDMLSLCGELLARMTQKANMDQINNA
ncbi:MAG: hypothetical protein KAJ45_03955, partial [Desulfobulbaceae bacterium]|nr:hypothetical protein [Desulfobulbaceae bacterium]